MAQPTIHLVDASVYVFRAYYSVAPEFVDHEEQPVHAVYGFLGFLLNLLEQDGITGWKAKRGILWYAFGNPGMFRKILGAWAAYFLPGFHPWNADEKHLIARYEAENPVAA